MSRKVVLRTLLGVVTVGVVGYFFYRERALFVGFGSTMSRIVWPYLVLAFAAEMTSIVPLAEAQRLVFATAGVDFPRGRMIAITYASNAISMSVPAGVAVAEGYAYRQYRLAGTDEAVAAWAELAAGAIAFTALATLALAGAIIDSEGAADVVIPTLAVVVLGAGAASSAFRRPEMLAGLVRSVARMVGRRLGGRVEKAAAGIIAMSRDLQGVQPSLEVWGKAFLLSGINWVLDIVCLALAFPAVGAAVPWGAVLLAFAGTKVLSSIGITPGGLGIVEGGLVAAFVAYGYPGATAAAAVVVYRALTLFGLVGLGWVAIGLLSLRRAQEV